MYTAVQPLAISGQLKASTLSPKPLCPALAAVLFGAMAGVEAPNPGAAEPISFRDNTNNLFHSFLKQYRPGFRR